MTKEQWRIKCSCQKNWAPRVFKINMSWIRAREGTLYSRISADFLSRLLRYIWSTLRFLFCFLWILFFPSFSNSSSISNLRYLLRLLQFCTVSRPKAFLGSENGFLLAVEMSRVSNWLLWLSCALLTSEQVTQAFTFMFSNRNTIDFTFSFFTTAMRSIMLFWSLSTGILLTF